MRLTKILRERISFPQVETIRKLFALFVIMMFMSSGISLEVVAGSGGSDGTSSSGTETFRPSETKSDEKTDEQEEEKGFEERELKDEDYGNADAYVGNPPKIFTNPNFDITKVPIDRVEQHIDVIIGMGRQNDLTQDQVRAISDPGKISILLQNMEPANIGRFSPEQIGSLSNEQLTALNPDQRAALTAEQLSNGNVLVNVGNLRDLDSTNLQAAMTARYGFQGNLFLISPSAIAVTITADGKIQNGEGSTIDIATITGADVKSVVISKPQDADNGFKICRTSTEPGKGCDFIKLSPETGEQMQYTFDPQTGKPYMEITKPDNTKSRIELNGEVHILGKDGITIIEVGEGSDISVLHGKETYTITGHNKNVRVDLDLAERTFSVKPKTIDPAKTVEENIPYFTVKSKSLDLTSFGAELFKKNDEKGEPVAINIKKINVGTEDVPIYFGSGQGSYNLDLANPESKNAVYTINGDGETIIERDNNGKILTVQFNKNKYPLPDGTTQYSEADVKVVQIINGEEKIWKSDHQVDFYFSDSPQLRSGKGTSVQDDITIQQAETGVMNKINAITDDTLAKDKVITMQVIKIGADGKTETVNEDIDCGSRKGNKCKEYLTAEFNERSLQNRIVLNKLSEREAGGRSYVTLTSDASGVLHTGAVASTSGGEDGNTLTVDRDGSESKLEFGMNAAVYIAPFDALNPNANQKYTSAIVPNIKDPAGKDVTVDNLYENNNVFYEKERNLVKETRTLPMQKTLDDGTLLEVKVGPRIEGQEQKFYALNTKTGEYNEYDVDKGEIIPTGTLPLEIRENLRDIEITEVTTSHKGAIASKVASHDIDIFKRFAAEGFVDKFKGGLEFADKSSYKSFLNNDMIILGRPENAAKLAEIKTPDDRIPNVFELNKDTKKLVAGGFAEVLADFESESGKVQLTSKDGATKVAATLDTRLLQQAKEDKDKLIAMAEYGKNVLSGYGVKGIDDLANKVVGLYITKAQIDKAKTDGTAVTKLKTQAEENIRAQLNKELGAAKGEAVGHTLDAARLSYEAGLAYTKDAAEKKRNEAVDELKEFIKGTGDRFAVQQGIGLIKEEFKLTGNHEGTRKLIQGIISGSDASKKDIGFNLNALSFSERQELGLELEKLEASTYSDEKDFDKNIAELKKLTEKYHQNLDDDIGKVMLQRIDEFKQGFNEKFKILSDEEFDKLEPADKADYDKEKKAYEIKKAAFETYLGNPKGFEAKTPDELKALSEADRTAYNTQLSSALTAANAKARTDTDEYLKDAISKRFLTPEQRAALLNTLAGSIASEGSLEKIVDIFGENADPNIKASLALLDDKQKEGVKASFAKTLAANVDETKLTALKQSDDFKKLPADVQAQLVYAAYERMSNSASDNNAERVRLANLAIDEAKSSGIAVSPELYQALSGIYARQGKYLESDLANREAAAALQTKAATQNYDSRKGFDFGTFVQGLDELARDNIEVQYAQKRFDSVIASGEFVVGATNLDRSVGDALDNKVRGAMAKSHTNLKEYEDAIKERETIIENIIGETEGVDPITKSKDNPAEKEMLKQQFVDAHVGISQDALALEDTDKINAVIDNLKKAETQQIDGTAVLDKTNLEDKKLIDALDKQAISTTLGLGELYEKKQDLYSADELYKKLLKDNIKNTNLDEGTKDALRNKIIANAINNADRLSKMHTSQGDKQAMVTLRNLLDPALGFSAETIKDVKKNIVTLDLGIVERLLSSGDLDGAQALIDKIKNEGSGPLSIEETAALLNEKDLAESIAILTTNIKFKKDENAREGVLGKVKDAESAMALFNEQLGKENGDWKLIVSAAGKYADTKSETADASIKDVEISIKNLEEMKSLLEDYSKQAIDNPEAAATVQAQLDKINSALEKKKSEYVDKRQENIAALDSYAVTAADLEKQLKELTEIPIPLSKVDNDIENYDRKINSLRKLIQRYGDDPAAAADVQEYKKELAKYEKSRDMITALSFPYVQEKIANLKTQLDGLKQNNDDSIKLLSQDELTAKQKNVDSNIQEIDAKIRELYSPTAAFTKEQRDAEIAKLRQERAKIEELGSLFTSTLLTKSISSGNVIGAQHAYDTALSIAERDNGKIMSLKESIAKKETEIKNAGNDAGKIADLTKQISDLNSQIESARTTDSDIVRLRTNYLGALKENVDGSKANVIQVSGQIAAIETDLTKQLKQLESKLSNAAGPDERSQITTEMNLLNQQLQTAKSVRNSIVLNGQISYNYEKSISNKLSSEVPAQSNGKIDSLIAVRPSDNEKELSAVRKRDELRNELAANLGSVQDPEMKKIIQLIADDSRESTSEIASIQLRNDIRKIMQETTDKESLLVAAQYLRDKGYMESSKGLQLQDVQYAVSKLKASGATDEEIPKEWTGLLNNKNFVSDAAMEILTKKDTVPVAYNYAALDNTLTQLGITDPDVIKNVETKLDKKVEGQATTDIANSVDQQADAITHQKSILSSYDAPTEASKNLWEGVDKGEWGTVAANAGSGTWSMGMATIGVGGSILHEAGAFINLVASGVGVPIYVEDYYSQKQKEIAKARGRGDQEQNSISKLMSLQPRQPEADSKKPAKDTDNKLTAEENKKLTNKELAKDVMNIISDLGRNSPIIDRDFDGVISMSEANGDKNEESRKTNAEVWKSSINSQAETIREKYGLKESEFTADDLINLMLANERSGGQLGHTMAVRAATTQTEILAADLRFNAQAKIDTERATQRSANLALIGGDPKDPTSIYNKNIFQNTWTGITQPLEGFKDLFWTLAGTEAETNKEDTRRKRESEGVEMITNLLNPSASVVSKTNRGITLESINKLVSSDDPLSRAQSKEELGKLLGRKVSDSEIRAISQALQDNPQVIAARAAELSSQGKLVEANIMQGVSFKKEAEIQERSRNLNGAESYAKLAAQSDASNQNFAEDMASKAKWDRATTPVINTAYEIGNIATGIVVMGGVGSGVGTAAETLGVTKFAASTKLGSWWNARNTANTVEAAKETATSTLKEATKTAVKSPVNRELAERTIQNVNTALQDMNAYETAAKAARNAGDYATAAQHLEKVSEAASRISSAQAELARATSIIKNPVLYEQVQAIGKFLKPVGEFMYKPGEIFDESVDEAIGETGETSKTISGIVSGSLGKGRSRLNAATNTKDYRAKSSANLHTYAQTNAAALKNSYAIYNGQAYAVDVDSNSGEITLTKAQPNIPALQAYQNADTSLAPPDLKIENLDQAQGILLVNPQGKPATDKEGQSISRQFGLLQLKVASDASKAAIDAEIKGTSKGETEFLQQQKSLVDADAEIKAAQRDANIAQQELDLLKKSNAPAQDIKAAESKQAEASQSVNSKLQDYARLSHDAAESDVDALQTEIDKVAQKYYAAEEGSNAESELEQQLAALEYIKQQKAIDAAKHNADLLSLQVNSANQRLHDSISELNAADAQTKTEVEQQVIEDAQALAKAQDVLAAANVEVAKEKVAKENAYQVLLEGQKKDAAEKTSSLNPFARKSAKEEINIIEQSEQFSNRQVQTYSERQADAETNQKLSEITSIMAQGTVTDQVVSDVLAENNKLGRELVNIDTEMEILEDRVVASSDKEKEVSAAEQIQKLNARKAQIQQQLEQNRLDLLDSYNDIKTQHEAAVQIAAKEAEAKSKIEEAAYAENAKIDAEKKADEERKAEEERKAKEEELKQAEEQRKIKEAASGQPPTAPQAPQAPAGPTQGTPTAPSGPTAPSASATTGNTAPATTPIDRLSQQGISQADIDLLKQAGIDTIEKLAGYDTDRLTAEVGAVTFSTALESAKILQARDKILPAVTQTPTGPSTTPSGPTAQQGTQQPALPIAPAAQTQPTKDVKDMTQEEFADYLMANRLGETDIYELLTRKPELRHLTKKELADMLSKDPSLVPANKKWANNHQTLWNNVRGGNPAINGVSAIGLESSWTNYQVGKGKQSSGDTHKGYLTFKDGISELTPELLQTYLDALSKRGYNGQIKVPILGARVRFSFDNIVMHGDSVDDVNLAIAVANELFGDKLSGINRGTDKDGKSHSQQLEERVKSGRAGTTAQQPALPIAPNAATPTPADTTAAAPAPSTTPPANIPSDSWDQVTQLSDELKKLVANKANQEEIDKHMQKARDAIIDLVKQGKLAAPNGKSVVQVFTTAQGSIYMRTSDGQTRRIKSPHGNTLGEDAGLHGWNQVAIFTHGDKSDNFNLGVAHLENKRFNVALTDKDGRVQAYIFDTSTNAWRPAKWSDSYPEAVKRGILPDIEMSAAYSQEPVNGANLLEYDLKEGYVSGVHAGSPVDNVLFKADTSAPATSTQSTQTLIKTKTPAEQAPPATSTSEQLIDAYVNLMKQKNRKDSTIKAVIDSLNSDRAKMTDNEFNAALVTRIAEEAYRLSRQANYPINPKAAEAEAKARTPDASSGIDVTYEPKTNWIYRGKFPGSNQKTVTRGSLNVEVTPELIDALDALIADGTIHANYKIGEAGVSTAPDTRHDAVTIYFLSNPSQEALDKISAIAKRFYRGDNLVGKKISDGFYMSEVGSISESHASQLIDSIRKKDPALGEKVRSFLSDLKTNRIAMSEGQYYALKDALNLVGIDIAYNSDTGFSVHEYSSVGTKTPAPAIAPQPPIQVTPVLRDEETVRQELLDAYDARDRAKTEFEKLQRQADDLKAKNGENDPKTIEAAKKAADAKKKYDDAVKIHTSLDEEIILLQSYPTLKKAAADAQREYEDARGRAEQLDIEEGKGFAENIDKDVLAKADKAKQDFEKSQTKAKDAETKLTNLIKQRHADALAKFKDKLTGELTSADMKRFAAATGKAYTDMLIAAGVDAANPEALGEISASLEARIQTASGKDKIALQNMLGATLIAKGNAERQKNPDAAKQSYEAAQKVLEEAAEADGEITSKVGKVIVGARFKTKNYVKGFGASAVSKIIGVTGKGAKPAAVGVALGGVLLTPLEYAGRLIPFVSFKKTAWNTIKSPFAAFIPIGSRIKAWFNGQQYEAKHSLPVEMFLSSWNTLGLTWSDYLFKSVPKIYSKAESAKKASAAWAESSKKRYDAAKAPVTKAPSKSIRDNLATANLQLTQLKIAQDAKAAAEEKIKQESTAAQTVSQIPVADLDAKIEAAVKRGVSDALTARDTAQKKATDTTATDAEKAALEEKVREAEAKAAELQMQLDRVRAAQANTQAAVATAPIVSSATPVIASEAAAPRVIEELKPFDEIISPDEMAAFGKQLDEANKLEADKGVYGSNIVEYNKRLQENSEVAKTIAASYNDLETRGLLEKNFKGFYSPKEGTVIEVTINGKPHIFIEKAGDYYWFVEKGTDNGRRIEPSSVTQTKLADTQAKLNQVDARLAELSPNLDKAKRAKELKDLHSSKQSLEKQVSEAEAALKDEASLTEAISHMANFGVSQAEFREIQRKSFQNDLTTGRRQLEKVNQDIFHLQKDISGKAETAQAAPRIEAPVDTPQNAQQAQTSAEATQTSQAPVSIKTTPVSTAQQLTLQQLKDAFAIKGVGDGKLTQLLQIANKKGITTVEGIANLRDADLKQIKGFKPHQREALLATAQKLAAEKQAREAATAEARAIAEEAARKAAAELEAASREAAQETDLVLGQITDIGISSDRITLIHAALKNEGIAKLEELAGFSAEEIKILIPSLTDAEARIIYETVNGLTDREATVEASASNIVKMSDYKLDETGRAFRILQDVKAAEQASLDVKTAQDKALDRLIDVSDSNPEVATGCSACSPLIHSVKELLKESQKLAGNGKFLEARKKVEEASKLIHEGMNPIVKEVLVSSINTDEAVKELRRAEIENIRTAITLLGKKDYKLKAELRQSLEQLEAKVKSWNTILDGPNARAVKTGLEMQRDFNAEVAKAGKEMRKDSPQEIKDITMPVQKRFAQKYFRTDNAKTAAMKIAVLATEIQNSAVEEQITLSQAVSAKATLDKTLKQLSDAEAQVVLDTLKEFSDSENTYTTTNRFLKDKVNAKAVDTVLELARQLRPVLDIAVVDTYLPDSARPDTKEGQDFAKRMAALQANKKATAEQINALQTKIGKLVGMEYSSTDKLTNKLINELDRQFKSQMIEIAESQVDFHWLIKKQSLTKTGVEDINLLYGQAMLDLNRLEEAGIPIELVKKLRQSGITDKDAILSEIERIARTNEISSLSAKQKEDIAKLRTSDQLDDTLNAIARTSKLIDAAKKDAAMKAKEIKEDAKKADDKPSPAANELKQKLSEEAVKAHLEKRIDENEQYATLTAEEKAEIYAKGLKYAEIKYGFKFDIERMKFEFLDKKLSEVGCTNPCTLIPSGPIIRESFAKAAPQVPAEVREEAAADFEAEIAEDFAEPNAQIILTHVDSKTPPPSQRLGDIADAEKFLEGRDGTDADILRERARDLEIINRLDAEILSRDIDLANPDSATPEQKAFVIAAITAGVNAKIAQDKSVTAEELEKVDKRLREKGLPDAEVRKIMRPIIKASVEKSDAVQQLRRINSGIKDLTIRKAAETALDAGIEGFIEDQLNAENREVRYHSIVHWNNVVSDVKTKINKFYNENAAAREILSADEISHEQDLDILAAIAHDIGYVELKGFEGLRVDGSTIASGHELRGQRFVDSIALSALDREAINFRIEATVFREDKARLRPRDYVYLTDIAYSVIKGTELNPELKKLLPELISRVQGPNNNPLSPQFAALLQKVVDNVKLTDSELAVMKKLFAATIGARALGQADVGYTAKEDLALAALLRQEFENDIILTAKQIEGLARIAGIKIIDTDKPVAEVVEQLRKILYKTGPFNLKSVSEMQQIFKEQGLSEADALKAAVAVDDARGWITTWQPTMAKFLAGSLGFQQYFGQPRVNMFRGVIKSSDGKTIAYDSLIKVEVPQEHALGQQTNQNVFAQFDKVFNKAGVLTDTEIDNPETGDGIKQRLSNSGLDERVVDEIIGELNAQNIINKNAAEQKAVEQAEAAKNAEEAKLAVEPKARAESPQQVAPSSTIVTISSSAQKQTTYTETSLENLVTAGPVEGTPYVKEVEDVGRGGQGITKKTTSIDTSKKPSDPEYKRERIIKIGIPGGGNSLQVAQEGIRDQYNNQMILRNARDKFTIELNEKESALATETDPDNRKPLEDRITKLKEYIQVLNTVPQVKGEILSDNRDPSEYDQAIKRLISATLEEQIKESLEKTGVGILAFSQEVVPGKTLDSMITTGELSETDLKKILAQLDTYQRVMHDPELGYYHMDLKPDNMMIVMENGEPKLVIIDYGVMTQDTSLKIYDEARYHVGRAIIQMRLYHTLADKAFAAGDPVKGSEYIKKSMDALDEIRNIPAADAAASKELRRSTISSPLSFIMSRDRSHFLGMIKESGTDVLRTTLTSNMNEADKQKIISEIYAAFGRDAPEILEDILSSERDITKRQELLTELDKLSQNFDEKMKTSIKKVISDSEIELKKAIAVANQMTVTPDANLDSTVTLTPEDVKAAKEKAEAEQAKAAAQASKDAAARKETEATKDAAARTASPSEINREPISSDMGDYADAVTAAAVPKSAEELKKDAEKAAQEAEEAKAAIEKAHDEAIADNTKRDVEKELDAANKLLNDAAALFQKEKYGEAVSLLDKAVARLQEADKLDKDSPLILNALEQVQQYRQIAESTAEEATQTKAKVDEAVNNKNPDAKASDDRIIKIEEDLAYLAVKIPELNAELNLRIQATKKADRSTDDLILTRELEDKTRKELNEARAKKEALEKERLQLVELKKVSDAKKAKEERLAARRTADEKAASSEPRTEQTTDLDYVKIEAPKTLDEILDAEPEVTKELRRKRLSEATKTGTANSLFDTLLDAKPYAVKASYAFTGIMCLTYTTEKCEEAKVEQRRYLKQFDAAKKKIEQSTLKQDMKELLIAEMKSGNLLPIKLDDALLAALAKAKNENDAKKVLSISVGDAMSVNAVIGNKNAKEDAIREVKASGLDKKILEKIVAGIESEKIKPEQIDTKNKICVQNQCKEECALPEIYSITARCGQNAVCCIIPEHGSQ